MHNLLITGGCGFIGSNLIHFLQKHNLANIKVLDDQSLGKLEHIADFDVEFIEGDIRDQSILKEVMIGVDSVVHLAAHTRVVESIENPDANFDTNVIGTYNVLKAAKETGVKSVINASTGGAILGEVDPPVNEGMVPRPIAPYGASKLAAEAYCSAFSGSYGMNITTLRFTNVYGPRSHHKGSVVAHFLKQIIAGKDLVIYGDGSQLRDYIYVDDLCHGIYLSLNASTPGEVFQLGTGLPTSVSNLIEIIKTTVGHQYPFSVQYENFRQGELRHTYADISKAAKQLGFSPQTSLAEGLANTWTWFLAQQQQQK